MGWLIKTTGSRTVVTTPHARLPAGNNGSKFPYSPFLFRGAPQRGWGIRLCIIAHYAIHTDLFLFANIHFF